MEDIPANPEHLTEDRAAILTADIKAKTEEIKAASADRVFLKNELIKLCPFKTGEKVRVVSDWVGAKPEVVFICFITVSNEGAFEIVFRKMKADGEQSKHNFTPDTYAYTVYKLEDPNTFLNLKHY